jgi:hypothetical protein
VAGLGGVGELEWRDAVLEEVGPGERTAGFRLLFGGQVLERGCRRKGQDVRPRRDVGPIWSSCACRKASSCSHLNCISSDLSLSKRLDLTVVLSMVLRLTNGDAK